VHKYMKLLQWNIWYQEDIRNILSTLREINPDIACLQEMTIDHPDYNKGIDTPRYLAENLGLNHFFKAAHDDPANTFGNAIFSRFPITESNFSFIKESSSPHGVECDYSDQGRVYVECLLDAGERKLSVGTTHMFYTDKFAPTPSKEAETNKLIEILSKKKDNFIFTGDLNALPGSYTINKIQKHLNSAGPNLEQNTWTTKPFSWNGFTADTLDWRLDYCFATPDIQIQSAKIIGTFYSDHLPILLEF